MSLFTATELLKNLSILKTKDPILFQRIQELLTKGPTDATITEAKQLLEEVTNGE